MAIGLTGNQSCEFMYSSLFVVDWDTADVTDEPLLDTVSRFLLSALLKHCGLALGLVHLHQHDLTHFYRSCELTVPSALWPILFF